MRFSIAEGFTGLTEAVSTVEALRAGDSMVEITEDADNC
jgi:hypothetical protein